MLSYSLFDIAMTDEEHRTTRRDFVTRAGRIASTVSLATLINPITHEAAVRNPFWHQAPDPRPGFALPSLPYLLNRGAVVLVCDLCACEK